MASSPERREGRLREAFERIENTTREHTKYRGEQFEEEMRKYREPRVGDDDEVFRKLVMVVFYSGFDQATVNEHKSAIQDVFPDLDSVADYGEDDVQAILEDPRVINHEAKIRAVVDNAKEMKSIQQEYGSFAGYLEAKGGSENLYVLTEALQSRFGFLGEKTVLHLLTNLGLPVLKPDRVVMRVLNRLGFVSGEDRLREAVQFGAEMAEATDNHIRYVDIVLVGYGQRRDTPTGLDEGICMEEEPRCGICRASNLCDYYQQRS